MRISFSGDGNGFDFHVEVDWQTLIALLKAVLATMLVLSTLVVAFGRIGF